MNRTISNQLTKKQKLFFKKYYEELKERFSFSEEELKDGYPVRNMDIAFFIFRLQKEAEGVGLFNYRYKMLRYAYSEKQIKEASDRFINEIKNRPEHLIACIAFLIEKVIAKPYEGIYTGFVNYVKNGVLLKYFSIVVESNLDYSTDY